MWKNTHNFATLAVMLGSLALSQANAQTLETVRVRLPSGQILSLDSDDWQRDRRIVEYRRYYYEPREKVYVVYNDNKPNHGHFCPPGQAKKGRC